MRRSSAASLAMTETSPSWRRTGSSWYEPRVVTRTGSFAETTSTPWLNLPARILPIPQASAAVLSAVRSQKVRSERFLRPAERQY